MQKKGDIFYSRPPQMGKSWERFSGYFMSLISTQSVYGNHSKDSFLYFLPHNQLKWNKKFMLCSADLGNYLHPILHIYPRLHINRPLLSYKHKRNSNYMYFFPSLLIFKQ